MDLATLIGLVGAAVLVGASVIMGTSPEVFMNPTGLLLVVGGSLFVVLAKFSITQFKFALKAAARAFKFQLPSVQASIDELVELAKVARREGMIALESREVNSPFLKKGLQMLADGYSAEMIKDMMEKERLLTLERNEAGGQVFSALGEVSPAMGMIGTLVGLVQMLSNMGDPSLIGPAMAVALLTTLYGAMIATMIANPIAQKLWVRMNQEAKMQELWIDALIAIKSDKNPRVLEQMLTIYLPPEHRGLPGSGETGPAGERT
ncbi:MotA/TolQ/ExbB proton channel family protein [Halomonas sp. XH26]|uniref:MotA/TolQ/ExbB proton channel family protein n=1 Tax=Vreelandella alkaliphila TaxID=272774 RepID=A0AAJ2S2Z0_9GAMM|nr:MULTISPECIES: MotA/TolQ/ExbB proton channel family protein [Halomonas]AIA75357.1 flagellar motor protein PomA [Halomonas campaniensis]EGP20458.1 MotA/TolQ/ExbB proton channel [Halomonas sp. TD01]MDX5978924.1 MotA/TolQ/ExbB proton channel family protein [Halomonas alkaliphila]UTA80830.1 MotA/TolQ/ExbB proton channel family protein [Halomonas sp. XH26]CAH1041655.1 Flagellar motor rotation protein MotA [Halomonas sp. TD01]